jgi:hypothetical protein
MDGGGDQFVKDLGSFRSTLNRLHIKAGISEDWDRPGTMSSQDGKGLAKTGSGVKANSDFVHAHVMPFYHGNMPESQTWDYIKNQVIWLKNTVGLPTMITETQWAWGVTEHYSSKTDVGRDQFTRYWKQFDSNCAFFKQNNVGWFMHAWNTEGTLSMLDNNGKYVIPNWRPQKC